MKEKTDNIDILEEFLDYYSFLKTAIGGDDIREFEIKISKNEIKAISTLIAENKELKDRNKRQQENLKITNKKIAAQRGQLMMLNKAYIPKSKVEELLKEIQEEGKIVYKNFMNKKLEEDFETDGAILQELGYIEGKLQSLLGKE